MQGSVKPALLKLIRDRKQRGKTMIVYATFQAQADELAGYLFVNGVLAVSYHAGKSERVYSLRYSSIPQPFDADSDLFLIIL